MRRILIGLGFGAAVVPLAGVANAADVVPPESVWSQYWLDVTGYNLMTEYGSDPAFGDLTPITGGGIGALSYSLTEALPELDGDGVRVSLRHQIDPMWFSSIEYSDFFTENSTSIGSAASDTDRVHANLLDRSLASALGLNGLFDDGFVDFASEEISVDQHFGDVVVGRRFDGPGHLEGSLRGGLRVAHTDVDRDVTYANLEGAADRDSVALGLSSEMFGVGPILGAGIDLGLGHGFTFSTSGTASALYSSFDLSRQETQVNQSVPLTGVRNVSMDTTGIVPVFDATVELSHEWGPFHAGIGYTASAWLGGGRTITTPGWDDVDGGTAAYSIREDDIITHGLFARVAIMFGGAQ